MDYGQHERKYGLEIGIGKPIKKMKNFQYLRIWTVFFVTRGQRNKTNISRIFFYWRGCMVDSLYERIKDIENTLWKLQMRLNIWILIKNLGTITFSSYNFLFYLNIEQANWKAHRSVISCVHQIDISNMNQWNRCSRGTNTKTRKPLIRKN